MRIIQDPDQDTTDMDKVFEEIDRTGQANSTATVTLDVVFGGLGGSLTHMLSNFAPAFKKPHRQVVYADQNNVALILHPGSHLIVAPVGTKCGMLPLGRTCRKATTKGLTWNLSTIN